MTNTNEFKEFVFERNNAAPLYLQLADFLKAKISSGEYAEGMRFPPESELAKILCIHRITLRKSLHILSSQNLITQIPHRGTFVAQRKEKRLRIGIVSNSRVAGTYMTALMLEIENALHLYPGTEQIFISLSDNKDKANLSNLENAMCDAILVPFGREYLFRFLDQKKYDLLPIVFINRYCRRLNGMRYSISLDTDAIHVGINFLTSRGHKSIAYITSIDDSPALRLRNKEFQRFVSKDISMFVGDKDSSRFQFAKEKTMELCRSENPPTAIMTPGISYTSGVWHGVLESGFKVPDDVSILGFDPMIDTYPMASTIDQPIAEMVGKAITLLHDLCSGKTYKRHLYLYKANVQERGSVRQLGLCGAKRKRNGNDE